MNLSHVKDWCIRYLLLDNKPRQIWYLKTILLIHSFCGSGIGLGVGWVPLVQELSSNSQGVSPGDCPFKALGEDSLLPGSLTSLLQISGPSGCWTEGLSCLLRVGPILSHFLTLLPGPFHSEPHNTHGSWLPSECVIETEATAIFNPNLHRASHRLCLILFVRSETFVQPTQGEEVNSREVGIFESS